MFPTFHNGEYLIVDEISYIVGTPKRGDVVIFKYPNDPSRYFIKRIIGLPNEEVIIKNGEITIKNKENPDGFKLIEPYINEKFTITENYKVGAEEYFVMGHTHVAEFDEKNKYINLGRTHHGDFTYITIHNNIVECFFGER